MKFKELTKKDQEKFTDIYRDKNLTWEERMFSLGKMIGKGERTVRNWAKKLDILEKPEVEPEQYLQAQTRMYDANKKRFIISWAQNNTPINDGLLKNMEAYAKHINADIHVILGRYKNPTSVFQDEEQENWAEEIMVYSDANRHNIHKYVSIMSDIKVQPTAVNPMTGMQALSGVNSCIFGAPKVQMEMIPVLEGNVPKMMLTTGALTIQNYTDSKSGKVGEFHHTFGFAIVEIQDEEIFHVRQVTADDTTGNFIDLFYSVENGKVKKNNEIEAIILGDLHYGHHDQVVLDSTLGLMDKLVPNHVVLHDVFDGQSISHHEMKDPILQFGKDKLGLNDLGKEIDNMMDGLSAFEKFKNVVIVRSNHDDFLDRWIKNEDWKRQPTHKNSRLYMQFTDLLLEQAEKDPYNVKGVIPCLINKRFPKFTTLGRSASYKVNGGWELGQHGDVGANGSRGSLLQFRKLNTKIIVGHYHSPGRKDGALAVGTSTRMRVGYNIGPSSWLQSHVIIHKDGRAQHINFIKDKNGVAHYTILK